MPEELTEEQRQYVRERGFEVVEGVPPKDELRPYFILGGRQKLGSFSDITFCESLIYGHGLPVANKRKYRRSQPLEKLIGIMEELVVKGRESGDWARAINNDPALAKYFDTRPDNPIKVFVVDPAWKEVAEKLAEKYPSIQQRL